MVDWRIKHGEVIKQFIRELNERTDNYVLKGGTSLMLCYGLNRFSEDVDLDSAKMDIEKYIQSFCAKNNYEYRVAKDTTTTQRYFVHFGQNKPLKIEVSHREKNIQSFKTKRNGISVYTIDHLANLKSQAYQGRDKLRDLFDLTFIVNNYYEELSVETISNIENVLSYKGIEQFDYLVNQQSDELIDNDQLADNFLIMLEKLDFFLEEEDKEILKEYGFEEEHEGIKNEIC